MMIFHSEDSIQKQRVLANSSHLISKAEWTYRPPGFRVRGGWSSWGAIFGSAHRDGTWTTTLRMAHALLRRCHLLKLSMTND